MDANGGVNFGMALGQGEGSPAGFEVGADGDHAGDPGFHGPADDRISVRVKIREIEMAMSINEHV